MSNWDRLPFDLNNSKNEWKINKLCENKSQYFEYYTKIATAFKEDCENLLLEFQKRNDLSFKAFAEVWKELSFSLVFVGQEFMDEISLFAESCYFTIKKYIILSESVNVKVGAFYLLYGIYNKQLSTKAVQIRFTYDEYSALLELLKLMKEKHMYDFVYIFNQMKFSSSFQLVATSRALGLEPKHICQERKMKDDIFVDVVDVSPVEKVEKILFADNVNSLQGIAEATQDYDEALKKYTAKNPSKLLSTLSKSHVVEDVRNIFHQMKELGEASRPVENDSSVLEIRRAIKQKAFHK